MPCDKFMEQPLEERLTLPTIPIDENNIAYLIRANPKTGYVQYKFPGKEWIDAN